MKMNIVIGIVLSLVISAATLRAAEKTNNKSTSPKAPAKAPAKSRNLVLTPAQVQMVEQVEALVEQGDTQRKAGNWAAAETAYRDAINVFPTSYNGGAETGLADALAAQGKGNEFLARYQNIFAKEADGPILRLWHGRGYERLGLQAEALASYRQAFTLFRSGESAFPFQAAATASDAEVLDQAHKALIRLDSTGP